MKRVLLLLLYAMRAAFAADTPADRALLQELAQKVQGAAAVAPPAEKLLAPDTLAFLTVPDWMKAQAAFTNSATGQLWADPAMVAFKEKFIEKFAAEKIGPLEKELGFQFTNFLKLARGQFTLAVVPNGWDGRSERQPGVLWLLDVKENASQLRTNLADLRQQWAKNGRQVRVEKIRDVEFTTVVVQAQEMRNPLQVISPNLKPPPPDEPKTRTVEWVIGQLNSLLIVSDAPRDVEKVLALRASVSVPALAEQPAFAASAPMLRDAQAFAWVHVKPIMATLARRPAVPQAEGGTSFGALPTVERMLNAFGLNGVQTIAFNLQPAPEGSMANIAIRVPEATRKGLFNLFAVSAKDAAPPAFVPADVVTFSRWRIDLQKGWTTIENALVEISPQFAGFSKLILDTAGKDKDPNFDFRKELLANLGDDLMTYERAPRPGSNAPAALTLIGAKNAEQLAASLRAITSIFPPEMVKYSERDFLGRKVYSVVIPPLPLIGVTNSTPLAYAAHAGYVALSKEVATLEEFIRGDSAAKPLRDMAGLNEAAQRIGGFGAGHFAFDNLRESTRAAFEAAEDDPSAVIQALGAGQFSAVLDLLGGDTASLVEPSLLPAFDRVAKYFHFEVSGIAVTPETITFKTFTPTPPALRK